MQSLTSDMQYGMSSRPVIILANVYNVYFIQKNELSSESCAVLKLNTIINNNNNIKINTIRIISGLLYM